MPNIQIEIKSDKQRHDYIVRMNRAGVPFHIIMGEEPIMNGDTIEYEDRFELDEADARRVFPELFEQNKWTDYHTGLAILVLLLVLSGLAFLVSLIW